MAAVAAVADREVPLAVGQLLEHRPSRQACPFHVRDLAEGDQGPFGAFFEHAAERDCVVQPVELGLQHPHRGAAGSGRDFGVHELHRGRVSAGHHARCHVDRHPRRHAARVAGRERGPGSCPTRPSGAPRWSTFEPTWREPR